MPSVKTSHGRPAAATAPSRAFAALNFVRMWTARSGDISTGSADEIITGTPSCSSQRPSLPSAQGKNSSTVISLSAVDIKGSQEPAERRDESQHRLPSRARPSPSVHRRDRELRAVLDARRPAGGHRLGAGVEADRIRPMLVEIAETRALPAAERIVGDRDRDWDIDPDHADLDLAGEVACGVAGAGEDGDAVPVFVIVAQPKRLAVVMRAHHRQHRPEDLFLVDAHILR